MNSRMNPLLIFSLMDSALPRTSFQRTSRALVPVRASLIEPLTAFRTRIDSWDVARSMNERAKSRS
jgi:hypothetical protein